jgi:hypothetical protein
MIRGKVLVVASKILMQHRVYQSALSFRKLANEKLMGVSLWILEG